MFSSDSYGEAQELCTASQILRKNRAGSDSHLSFPKFAPKSMKLRNFFPGSRWRKVIGRSVETPKREQ